LQIRKKILIFYDYFDPAYKAGGPIRSLVNLVHYLESEIDFYIITSNQDHDGTILDVVPDRWINYASASQVIYLSRRKKKFRFIKKLAREVSPHLIYVNGIFSIPFVVFPLLIAKSLGVPVVVSPRGMLQKKPLTIKPFKKGVYLSILKLLTPKKNTIWHFTQKQEMDEFKERFSNFKRLHLVGNIPRTVNEEKVEQLKKKKVFGTIALISPMKNLHLIFQTLADMRLDITYTLYGPIKDQSYWAKCLDLAGNLPQNVQFEYWGPIHPSDSLNVMKGFDYYIQPSQSENFGHAIFEALSMGIPVITSNNTPWQKLKAQNAGWNVEVSDGSGELKEAVMAATNVKPDEYSKMQKGAKAVACKYWNKETLKEKYLLLFQI